MHFYKNKSVTNRNRRFDIKKRLEIENRTEWNEVKLISSGHSEKINT